MKIPNGGLRRNSRSWIQPTMDDPDIWENVLQVEWNNEWDFILLFHSKSQAENGMVKLTDVKCRK